MSTPAPSSGVGAIGCMRSLVGCGRLLGVGRRLWGRRQDRANERRRREGGSGANFEYGNCAPRLATLPDADPARLPVLGAASSRVARLAPVNATPGRSGENGLGNYSGLTVGRLRRQGVSRVGARTEGSTRFASLAGSIAVNDRSGDASPVHGLRAQRSRRTACRRSLPCVDSESLAHRASGLCRDHVDVLSSSDGAATLGNVRRSTQTRRQL
jgi:hypothetical protein